MYYIVVMLYISQNAIELNHEEGMRYVCYILPHCLYEKSKGGHESLLLRVELHVYTWQAGPSLDPLRIWIPVSCMAIAQ